MLGGAFAMVGTLLGLVTDAQQMFQPFVGPGAAPLIWGIGAVLALAVIVLLFTRWRTRPKPRLAMTISVLWVIPLVLVTGTVGATFGALVRSSPSDEQGPGGEASSSSTPSPTNTASLTDPPTVLSFAVIGECTEAGGELSADSGGFTPGRPYTVAVAGPYGAALTPGVPTPATVDENGKVAWRWACPGSHPGRYTTELVDKATGRSTGPVGFTVGSAASGLGPGSPTTIATPTATPDRGPTPPAPPTAAPLPPPQQPSVTFEFAAPVGPVPRCTHYRGTGTEPPGGRLVVLMLHRPDDQNYYYEKPVKFDGSGNWLAAYIVVGEPLDTGLFVMEAYEVTPEQERELAKYVNKPAPRLGTLIRTLYLERSTEQGIC